MAGRFQDRVAIVTGGCAGIGSGIVDVLVEAGGKVAVLDIDAESGSKFNHDQIHFIKCDVTSDNEVETAVAETIAKYGKLDLLVNNAGVQIAYGCADEISVDEFRRCLEINLVAYFRMIHVCIPHLRKTTGSIVNISSSSNQCGFKNAAAYCAAKGDISAMTRALGIDEGRKSGVRVNCISPGIIQTPMLDKVLAENPAMIKPVANSNQLGRLGTTREVGLSVLYLATDATYCTGTDLLVAGGYDLGLGEKQ